MGLACFGLVLCHINYSRLFNAKSIFIRVVGDRSRGRPEDTLFNSCDTEV